mmetsp:Transcript_59769/g.131232  ORF Transcript_59769/g.131232 Transcript_59769/m.131232 type:complete len:482 (-) Transcript_59769:1043-2488(-)
MRTNMNSQVALLHLFEAGLASDPSIRATICVFHHFPMQSLPCTTHIPVWARNLPERAVNLQVVLKTATSDDRLTQVALYRGGLAIMLAVVLEAAERHRFVALLAGRDAHRTIVLLVLLQGALLHHRLALITLRLLALLLGHQQLALRPQSRPLCLGLPSSHLFATGLLRALKLLLTRLRIRVRPNHVLEERPRLLRHLLPEKLRINWVGIRPKQRSWGKTGPHNALHECLRIDTRPQHVLEESPIMLTSMSGLRRRRRLDRVAPCLRPCRRTLRLRRWHGSPPGCRRHPTHGHWLPTLEACSLNRHESVCKGAHSTFVRRLHKVKVLLAQQKPARVATWTIFVLVYVFQPIFDLLQPSFSLFAAGGSLQYPRVSFQGAAAVMFCQPLESFEEFGISLGKVFTTLLIFVRKPAKMVESPIVSEVPLLPVLVEMLHRMLTPLRKSIHGTPQPFSQLPDLPHRRIFSYASSILDSHASSNGLIA